MIDLIFYETATGRVTRQLTLLDEYERDQNLREGESYLLGSVNPSEVYVKAGEVKSYPPKPASYMTFDFTTETWVDPRTPEDIAEDLANYILDVVFKVNSAVSTVRKNYITDIAGQDMIYMRKEEQAISYIAATDPILSQYPMIAAEVGLTATTAYEVAQVWLYMSDAWQQIAAGLENVRLTATYAIEAATTEAEVQAAYAAFETSLAALGV